MQAAWDAEQPGDEAHFLELLERSRALAITTGSADQRAWIESIAAQRLLARAEAPAARAVLERAIAQHPTAVEQRASLHLHLAEALVAEGRLGDARVPLAEARRACDASIARDATAGPSQRDRTLAATIAGVEADTCLVLGLMDHAARACDRESEFATGLDVYARIDSALRRMNVALAIEDFRDVLRIADERADEAREAEPASYARFQIRRAIARAELARASGESDLREAERTVLEALAIPGTAPGEIASARRLAADLALRRGDLAQARERLALIPDRPAPDGAGARDCGTSALESALRARLVLAERGDRRALEHARDDLRARLEASCRAWEREPAPPGGLGFLHWGTQRRVLSELVRLEIALDPDGTGAERALEHVIRAQRVGGLARSLGGLDAGTADVRRELTVADSVVLVVLPAPERTHVFLVDADGVRHAESAGRDRLVELAGRAWSALASTDGADADLRDLARELLPAAFHERIARCAHVRVCGLELCGEPPFELLPLADRGEIGLAVAVSYLPSLPSAVGLARRAEARSDAVATLDLLVLADPVVDADVTRRFPRASAIGLTDDEAQSLLGPTSFRARALPRADASLPALADALRARPRMLTIVAHGIHDATRDLPAGIVLARGADSDGTTWAEDVARLEAPPFVALLACGAGRGRVRLGDDAAAHFGGALLGAGADCTLVARSDLTVRAAIPLGAMLAERVLARGDEPAIALLAGRRALAADPELDDPRERAQIRIFGFSCVPPAGAARAAEAAARPRGAAAWFVGLGIGGVVLAGVVWLRSRRGSPRRSPTEPGPSG